MQRAEATGLGVAAVGHILLFGILSLGLTLAPKPVPPLTQPVDIQIVDEVGLRDTAPDPSPVEPAPSVAPEVGPPVEAPLPEPTPAPLPKVAPAPTPPKPTPKPAPKVATPASKPAVKPVPAAPPRPKLALDLSRPQPQQAPRGSRLGNDFLKGVSDRPTASTAQTPRAAAGPAVEASLAREVLRQLKPHWKAPTGADAEKLRTTLSISLARDGTVAAVRVIETTGVTDSNRGQVRLHQEAAVKAVRLAAPFVLPAELYDAWKVLEPVGFDKRLG
jgi:outer membrane biosynthesis protein TonB